MAYYPQQNRRKLTVGADGNALMNLIAILLMIFVVFAFIQVVYTFTYTKLGSARYHEEVFPWVALPADLGTLAARPWTLLTHPFVNDDVWRVVSSLLWLWAFGYIYQDFTGYRKLIPLFLYGSLAGALVFVAVYNLVPGLRAAAPAALAFGASPGVMAIAVATTVQAPKFRIFPMLNGGIPLWVLTLIYAIIVLATIPYSRPGEHAAHLGAAVLGFVFQVQQNRGRDWAAWMNRLWDWFTNLFNPDKPAKGRPQKDELFYNATVPPYQKKTNYTQQRVDEILDKINQKGVKSLTEEEREILRRASSDGNV
ncbi:MAG: rhomboid family intramembrane serine protease [Chitinophagaceae bacterium]|nr:MAG: rhomboid family intramembrane serine protease [Chitinophagaceae bacterium]